jgi:hypothetical protein
MSGEMSRRPSGLIIDVGSYETMFVSKELSWSCSLQLGQCDCGAI